MGSTITLSWFELLGIIAVSIFAGWMVSRLPLLRMVRISFTNGVGNSSSGVVIQKKQRILQLKCKCGSEWRFRDGSGPNPPGFESFPAGNSFVCPNCGTSIDLSQERKLEADALANLTHLN